MSIENAQKLELLYENAVTMHQRGDLDGAIQLYNQILSIDPNYTDAVHHLGVIYYQKKQFSEAIKYFDMAQALDPNSAEIYNNRGLLQISANKIQEATQSYATAIRLKPNFAEAYSNLGICQHRLGKLESSLKSFNAAIRLRKKYPEAHYNRGNVLKDLKRYDDALDSYSRAISESPKYFRAYCNRGLVLSLIHRFKEALEDYNTALAIAPSYPEALRNRMNLRAAVGDYLGASDDATKIIKMKLDKSEFTSHALKVLLHCYCLDYLKSKYFKNEKSLKVPEAREKTALKPGLLSLEIVTFFVPISDELELGQMGSAKSDWNFFLKLFYSRAKKIAPAARIILITDENFLLPEDLPPYKIFRTKIDKSNLMYSRMIAQDTYLRQRLPLTQTLILDLDVVIGKFPSDLLQHSPDVALTTRYYCPPVNAGVIYLGPSRAALGFYKKCIQYYDDLTTYIESIPIFKNINLKAWWGDQIAMCAAAEVFDGTMKTPDRFNLEGINFFLLDCEKYNFSQEYSDRERILEDIRSRYFIHFKGTVTDERKEIMEFLLNEVR